MVAYWLVPAEPHRSAFAAIIRELAQRYEAPVFAPHVTLYSDDADEQSARALLDQLAKENRAIELAVRGIDYSDKFTKTLFVEFENTPEAQQLADAIRKHSSSSSDYEFSPHLSLLYAQLPNDTKAKEARAVRIPSQRIRFDAISAIQFPRSINSRADVEAWRTIGIGKLIG